jgi:thymidylate synthase (FAD)
MNVKLINYSEKPLAVIEEAARVCYDSDAKDGKIAEHCIKTGHTSVTEFADFTFLISGVSRALTHQLVRHRIASYAQRSQRYCREDNAEMILPETIKNNSEAFKIFDNCMRVITDSYAELVELGIPNEDARMVLPNACSTTIVVKMNFRTLMNFFNERLCTRAQWEIRKLARLMKEEIIKVEPRLAKYCVPKCEKYENKYFCTEMKSCGKHPKLSEIFEIYNKSIGEK